MADKGQKVGDVHFDVHANVESLSPELEAAKAKIAAETGGGKVSAETAKYAEKASAEMNGLGGTLKDVKKKYGEQVEVVQGLIGKIGAIGATAVIAYKAGEAAFEAFSEVLKNGTDRAKEFKDSLDLSDVQGSLKKYDEELADLDARMAGRKEGNVLGMLERLYKSDATLQKEIDEKRQTRESLARADKARKDSEARAKAKQDAADAAKEAADKEADIRKSVLGDIASARRAAELDQMDERARTEAEGNDKIKELREKFLTLDKLDQVRYAKVFADARYEIEADLNAKLRKLDEETTKKRLEEAKKIADAFVSGFRSIREASNSVFNTDQAASMVQFAQQMQVSATMAHANMNRIVVEGVG